MPFLKNLEKQICQVYDNEVKPLLEKGWKELTTIEEEVYREGLATEHDLTSAASIELARVKAGLYKTLGQAEKTAQTVENSVNETKTTSTSPKSKTVAKAVAKKVVQNATK